MGPLYPQAVSRKLANRKGVRHLSSGIILFVLVFATKKGA